MNKNQHAILFSRVQLRTDDGVDSEFWVSGYPQEYDDLEDTEGFIDFQEFHDGLPGDGNRTATADVASFREGDGALRPASPEDMDRIEKAVAEVDIDTISGWNRLGQHMCSSAGPVGVSFGGIVVPPPPPPPPPGGGAATVSVVSEIVVFE